jgi:putative DNA primase/helicase
VTPAVVQQHFRTTRPEHVFGLHTTSPSNTSRWGAVEVDWHGETSLPAEINFGAAIAWHDLLRNSGLNPLLTDSNGRGGYHLLRIFSREVSTPTVFNFLKWLTRNHAQLGLRSPPETFPKQPRIDPGRHGKWLRVPGRHHTREHWSRVWGGSAWLEGAAAIDFMRGIRGDDPTRIPA